MAEIQAGHLDDRESLSIRVRRRLATWKRRLYGNLVINYGYDLLRFRRANRGGKAFRNLDREQSAAHLLKSMHSLEKGLSLPEPKPGFGKRKAVRLAHEADGYGRRFGEDRTFRLCVAVLDQYVAHSAADGFDYADDVGIARFATVSRDVDAGADRVRRDDIWRQAKIDFEGFARSRRSVRMFTGEAVPEVDILKAIDIATKSPSVCNRSVGRAYYTNEPATIRELLSYQDGNRGFGHQAGAVIVVAADMRAFFKAGERNQAFVDGGLFAMTLNYALHAQGYGTCMLNWSMHFGQDRALRNAFPIADEHAIVTYLAVGHMPEEMQLAASPRRDPSEYAFSLNLTDRAA